MSGWSVCNHRHLPRVNTWRIYSYSDPQTDCDQKFRRSVAKKIDSSSKSSSRSGSARSLNGSFGRKNPIVPPSTPVDYEFHHYRNPRQYIAQYRRENYTSKQKNRQPLPGFSVSHHRQISKAGLKCIDVRHGATIQPCYHRVSNSWVLNYRNSAMKKDKKSQTATSESVTSASGTSSHDIQFLIQNKMTCPKSPSSQTIQSCSVPDISATLLDKVTSTDKAVPTDKEVQNCHLKRKPSPVIRRSRPTIPSNANGTVCQSAIETPIYILPSTKSPRIHKDGNKDSIKKK
ncbi:uncharacterized protein LOC106158522 isoform X2 [Lingula anatina]|uniref:Uncharacterized protein LOC106158522 isoform X2 n=1 Tax=Lingula anatina TaxID=7574 RepID=A0A1S3HVF2_LINAN|nr:uncharacterized protein LOC106158522 isoform X2 [Lingula anatina]|eukprot:XP_013390003.1 uncharacterized protein LOC106158522 isoform X2 [Lingula anatina]